MRCTTTTTCSMIVNAKTGKTFQPEKGIGQEDPISPYFALFVQNV